MIKAVSFDCAQTLLQVRWNPVEVAMKAADLAGVEFSPTSQRLDREAGLGHKGSYARLFGSRQDDWKRACSRHEKGYGSHEFWHSLTFDWLKEFGQESKTERVIAAAEEVLYGPESCVFLPMPGARQSVLDLKNQGLKVIVLSNWDDSLVKVLTHCGLADLFDGIFASLVEACEKPEPEFFSIGHESLGLRKEEILHVGDNPLDDAVGALTFGWQALLFKNHLAAGPWELNDESKALIHRNQPDFPLDPWLPCPVIYGFSEAVEHVRELNS